MSARRTVALVGIAQAGPRVGARLVEVGHEVRVWGEDREAVRELEAQGAEAAGSPVEAASGAELCFGALADEKALREVVLGAGLFAAMPEGAVFADLCPASPALARELAAEGRESGVAVLDVAAPAAASVLGQSGLVLLVGGDAEAIERVSPLLEQLSPSVLRVGAAGAGAAMRLAEGALLGIGAQALAEALAFAEAAGVERERALDALGQVAAVAAPLRSKLANVRAGDYPVERPLRRAHLELTLVLDVAQRAGIELPLTEASARACADALRVARQEVDASYVIGVSRRRRRRASRPPAGSPPATRAPRGAP